MRSARRNEQIFRVFRGREADFAVLFVDDVQNQLDLIPEDANELMDLFCALKETPNGEAFLSLLLGMSTEAWLDENIHEPSDDDDDEG
jgi:hypothetical protein